MKRALLYVSAEVARPLYFAYFIFLRYSVHLIMNSKAALGPNGKQKSLRKRQVINIFTYIICQQPRCDYKPSTNGCSGLSCMPIGLCFSIVLKRLQETTLVQWKMRARGLPFPPSPSPKQPHCPLIPPSPTYQTPMNRASSTGR
uniref:Uncharacterized protein n=1 Tax=Sphaerodactylus townsendi TaxID=933632 RepID=A0ACB8EHS3_9SAUR